MEPRGGLILGKRLGRRRDLGKAGEGSCPWPCSTSDLRDPPGMGQFLVSHQKTPSPGILAWEFSADKVLLVQEKAGVCLLYLANYQEVRNAWWGGERSSHTHPGRPQAGEQTPCSFLGEELEIKPKANKLGLIVQTLHLWQLCLGRGSTG